jgi:predicted O-methyltransferase YrrM
MDADLEEYLQRLYKEGQLFDAREPDRRRRRRNLEPDSANLLWMLVVATGARKLVEIGTSNGYSTLWLADAARLTGGQVITVEIDPAVQSEAARHLRSSGLQIYVELVATDAGPWLAKLQTESVDLLFLDSERTDYPSWWPHPLRVVRPGGMLVIDNAISHADEVAPFAELLAQSGQVVYQLVQIGKGELICVKTPGREAMCL